MTDPRPGRARSQTTPTPRTGLYRMVTPIDHIDTLILDENNHNPTDSPAGTPRTSLTLINGTEGPFGHPEVDNRRKIDPVYEEALDTESGSRDDQIPREKQSSLWEKRPDQNLSKRERAGSNARRQSLTRRITGTLRPSASRLSEDQGVSPEERKWKDDIVTFDSKVRLGALDPRLTCTQG